METGGRAMWKEREAALREAVETMTTTTISTREIGMGREATTELQEATGKAREVGERAACGRFRRDPKAMKAKLFPRHRRRRHHRH